MTSIKRGTARCGRLVVYDFSAGRRLVGDGRLDEWFTAFERRYRRPLCEGYGLSEASPVVSLNPPHGPRKAGSVGKPLPGLRVTLVDAEGREVPAGETGELCVQGASVMQGYFRLPEETAGALRGGMLHSGDLARLDDEGYVFSVGRLKGPGGPARPAPPADRPGTARPRPPALP